MAHLVTVFMCGDVMTGRGIDQILPHPGVPAIYEPYMKSAKAYVKIAQEVSGRIPEPVDFSYVWGDAFREWERIQPDVRIINLETSVTKSNDYWPDKGINYRMHPENIACFSAARIDYCSLSNNHVLDWGYSGLAETIETLKKAGIKSAGAGKNLKEAETPAALEIKGKGRIIVFSAAVETSGIPPGWAASKDRPGVNLISLTDRAVQRIKKKIMEVRRARDIAIVSIHWGSNWGYDIPREHMEFAHELIDTAGVDVIHGHSSHHPKGIEVYKEKPIIYGCGDFLNDYEGIGGYEYFRGDLSLMYFAAINPVSARLAYFNMTPVQIKRFKVNRASKKDTLWLRDVLNRECKEFGTQVKLSKGNTFTLIWKTPAKK